MSKTGRHSNIEHEKKVWMYDSDNNPDSAFNPIVCPQTSCYMDPFSARLLATATKMSATTATMELQNDLRR